MKTQNPWMGRVKGSAGNMTGCKVYDKNVLRAKAFEVSNPNTQAQKTQRDFFKEVAGIVATVTDEELRSLFGQKPKSMSRRNALSKQVAAANTVDGTSKVVDFSKLYSIGNGDKCETPIVEFINGVSEDETVITAAMLGSNAKSTTNLIGVFFNSTDMSIQLVNTAMLVGGNKTTAQVLASVVSGKDGFGYVTCDTNGADVNTKSFGSFIIKVRPEKKGKDIQKGPQSIDIQASGFNAWDTFTIDLNGTSAEGATPTSLVNDGNVVASSFSEASENVFTGSFVEAVDETAATTLTVTMPDESEITFNVNFVD